jgi:competence protein ComEA
MSNLKLLGAGIVIGFLFSGFILLIAAKPGGEEVKLIPAPTPMPIFVYVTGAVEVPGVYSLERGDRVLDAIEAAGGELPDASLDSINLAAVLQDGAKIFVPDANNPLTSDEFGAISTPVLMININIASQQELELLPGIGSEKALAIIAYREENGFFSSIEGIMDVPGIGEQIYNQIKGCISIE